MNDVSSNKKSILKIENVTFRIQKQTLLDQVSAEIHSGEVVALVGHNGAGKTTLFHLILGLKFQSAGAITIQGIPATQPASRRWVSFVPERPYLNLSDTGTESVSFFQKLSGVKSDITPAAVLKRVGLEDAQNKKLQFYSKGMLQRTLMAQALINDPVLLILDEPMSGLDPEGRAWVRGLISELKSQGKTVLFSTHTLEDVDQLADRVWVLEKGKTQYIGTPQEWSRT